MRSAFVSTRLLTGAAFAALAAAPSLAQNGACYLPNSTCSQITAAACTTAGGVFGGVGVPCPPYQINGAGATLFADFATNAALTNDFINIDFDYRPDFVSGVPVLLRDIWDLNDGNGPQADQCGPSSPASAAPNQVWWIHQYRSVGSVEGYEEFINFQLCGDIPENLPSERGSLNSLLFASVGAPVGSAAAAGWGGGGACTLDLDPAQADGPNASNTPVCPETIDYANVDVPGVWATRSVIPAPPDDKVWNRKPGEPGYGTNPHLSYYDPDVSLPSNPGNPDGDRTAKLASLDPADYGCAGVPLNFNLGSPDGNTLYDTEIAWSPVSINCNRGVAADWNNDGIEDGTIRYTDLQHGFVTGRMRSGENIAFGCRDVGSGTRNDCMNSLGIDPSYANGDNDGPRVFSPPNPAGFAEFLTRPGPGHQVANSAGSSVVESATKNRRLCIAYTGVFGSSRTQGDARAGHYEAMSVVKDVVGGGTPAGTQPVFPTLDAILDNCDPDTGFQIGAIQTLITRGNPRAHDFGTFAPIRETGPLMARPEAAKFVRNIEESISVPVGVPPRIMPGQFIALNSSVVAGIDCISLATDPLDFSAGNSNFDQAIQDFIRNNNTLRAGSQPIPPYGDVDASGAVRPAGFVPHRRGPAFAITEPTAGGNGTANAIAQGDDVQLVAVGAAVSPGQTIILPGANGVLNTNRPGGGGDDDIARDVLSYRDGGNGVQPGYRYWNGSAFVFTGTTASQALSRRNAVQGDLNNDGRRDVNDTAKLVEAWHRFSGLSGETVDQVLQNFEAIISNAANDNGSMDVNRLILHVTADFNGDGEFDARDLRYWADGLAIYPFNHGSRPRELDRKNGFVQVDTQWATRTGVPNSTPFGPITLATGTYQTGDARGDVAGGAYIQPGGTPRGYDGQIDLDDIAYVQANFVTDWSDTDQASGKDLSADMDGDLDVDCDDVREIVENILDSEMGDINLDGVRDATDCNIATPNLNQPGNYGDGDVNCDGMVTNADLAIICGAGCSGANGDANCNGAVDFFDIDPFLLALFNPAQYAANFCGGNNCAADVDNSGAVDFFDIDPFLACLFSPPCP